MPTFFEPNFTLEILYIFVSAINLSNFKRQIRHENAIILFKQVERATGTEKNFQSIFRSIEKQRKMNNYK